MPTYRNDGDVAYRIENTDNKVENVIPGHTVQTYDRTVPDDFTETLATPANKVAISGEDVWTNDVLVNAKSYLNVSISGEAGWEATVTLQRRFDTTEAHRDIRTFISDSEKAFTDEGNDVLYRIGIKAGEHTSGTIVVELNK